MHDATNRRPAPRSKGLFGVLRGRLEFPEVSVSATGCLAGQLDAAVRAHREGRVPRHLPQKAVGVGEETVAPEEDLLRLLDYRRSCLGRLREYRVHLPL